MKILYVTTVYNTFNAFLIPHIEELLSRGHQVDVATSGIDNISDRLKSLNCNFFEIPFSRSPLSKSNYNSYLEIKKLIRENDYDILHTHTPVASAISRLAVKSFKNDLPEVIYTVHGFHFFKGASFVNWITYYPIERFLSKSTDKLITINKEDFEFAKSKKMNYKSVNFIEGVGIDINKFNVVSNDEKVKLRKQLGYKEDDFLLFYAAELNGNKNQQLLVNSIKVLIKHIPTIKLVLAGVGPLEKNLINLIEQLGLEKSVILLGFTSNIDMWLKCSDVSVASSMREGLPVNLLEAMATGLPVVATNVRGHIDLIDNNVNGFLLKDKWDQEFIDYILKIYNDKALYTKFSRNSRQMALKYSVDEITSKIADLHEI